MAVKKYKPTTPGQRGMTGYTFEEITKSTPERSLTVSLGRHGGRNAYGRVTVRHRGGGNRRLVRVVDFKREKFGIPAKVAAIEYDPGRTARLALLHYIDGEKRYILSPEGVKAGDQVESGMTCEPKVGNAMPLESIPGGLEVHNIEMNAGQGGKIVRVAGSAARIVAKEGDWVTLALPSGEMRMVRKECRATIGRLSNADYQNISWGKAGRTRHKGRRGHVRGKAQNPVSHPLGGGEGRSNGGRHPCSPTGVLAKGGKTRCPRKISNKRIIRRRRGTIQGQMVV